MTTEIIAEMGASHQQSFAKAVAIIKVTKEIEADGIKVSMFTPDDMTLNEKGKQFDITKGPWAGYNLYELYRESCMPFDWIPQLKEVAESLDLKFIVSVYHPDTVDKAEKMGIETYKVASFELRYDKLLKRLAQTKKPVILSTGSATYKEIQRAVRLFKTADVDLTLLKCTSSYPAEHEDMNLRTIPALAHGFKVKVGLSDHSLGIVAPVIAVSLGATMIEKHISLDEDGLDSDFAVLPDRFNRMVKTIRAAEASLGEVTYGGKKSYHRRMVNGRMVRTVWN